jgi:hypothetical protein
MMGRQRRDQGRLFHEFRLESAQIGNLPMLVLVDVPLSEAFQPAKDALRWTVMLTLGVMLAVLAGVWLRAPA